HMYETTRAALEGFARFVPPGGFFVVEDGCVDVEELRPDDRWPRGVLRALDEWLESPAGAGFVVRRDLEPYGIPCHPRGSLQRRVGAARPGEQPAPLAPFPARKASERQRPKPLSRARRLPRRLAGAARRRLAK